MINNRILRSLGYTLSFNFKQFISVFSLGGLEISEIELENWMKKEEEELFEEISDIDFSAFLNGLIVYKRGKKEGTEPVLEKKLNNNLIVRKLRIAFNLKDQDMIDILMLVDFKITKSELSALFRNTNHSNYRECKDQLLRNFLNGLAQKYKAK